jgi:CHAD domain-containing protein
MSIPPDLPLGEFARAQALERLSEVSERMRQVRRNPNADAVHDLRVAIRRFSSVLQVFPECFSAKRAKKGRKRLKQVLKAAGEVRDRDIARGLAAQAETGNGNFLGLRLERERRRSAQRLRSALAKDRRKKILAAAKRAVRLAKKPPAGESGVGGWRPLEPANENAVTVLPERIRDLFESARQALREPIDPAELHALRLKTKRRRYTVELFAPCYGPDIEERLRQLKCLQDLLGRINDCRASKDLTEGEGVEEYLERERERLIAEFRRYWNDVFDAPGECEGWMLELARRSSTHAAAAAI